MTFILKNLQYTFPQFFKGSKLGFVEYAVASGCGEIEERCEINPNGDVKVYMGFYLSKYYMIFSYLFKLKNATHQYFNFQIVTDKADDISTFITINEITFINSAGEVMPLLLIDPKDHCRKNRLNSYITDCSQNVSFPVKPNPNVKIFIFIHKIWGCFASICQTLKRSNKILWFFMLILLKETGIIKYLMKDAKSNETITCALIPVKIIG